MKRTFLVVTATSLAMVQIAGAEPNDTPAPEVEPELRRSAGIFDVQRFANAVPASQKSLASITWYSNKPRSEPDGAASEPGASSSRRAVRYDLRVNRPATAGIIVGGALLWVGSDRVFQDTLAPKSCRLFCEDRVNAFDATVGKSLTWQDDSLPQTLSDGAAYVAIPLIGFGGLSLAAYKEGNRSDWIDDMLVVAESTVAIGMVNRLFALSFGRTRPRTRAAAPDDPVRLHRQAHESFFSGHTSAAFSIGVSAAMVARLRGYKAEPYLWTSAFIFGAATGYFRLAGADHYPSDVVVGAAVATGMGILIPWLHRKKTLPLGAKVSASPVLGGGALSLSGAW